MLAPISHGHIVSFFRDRVSKLNTYYDAGGILASQTTLLNWQVEFVGTTNTGSNTEWRLLSLSGNPDVSLDGSLLTSHVLDDSAWVTYNGGTLPTIPCGLYEIELFFRGSYYYSSVLEVTRMDCAYQRAGLKDESVRPDNSGGIGGVSMAIVPDDIASGVTSSSFEFSTDGSTWTSAGTSHTPTGTTYYRRTIVTTCGASNAYYTYSGGQLRRTSGESADSTVVFEMNVTSDQPHNRILYHRNFVKNFYIRGPLAGPVFESSPQFLANGDGERFLSYAETTDALVLTATGVPDSALGGLQEGKYLNTSVKRVGATDALECVGYEVSASVSSIPTLNNVQLTFQRAVYTTRHCEEPLDVTP